MALLLFFAYRFNSAGFGVKLNREPFYDQICRQEFYFAKLCNRYPGGGDFCQFFGQPHQGDPRLAVINPAARSSGKQGSTSGYFFRIYSN